jgi:hypothetical protein
LNLKINLLLLENEWCCLSKEEPRVGPQNSFLQIRNKNFQIFIITIDNSKRMSGFNKLTQNFAIRITSIKSICKIDRLRTNQHKTWWKMNLQMTNDSKLPQQMKTVFYQIGKNKQRLYYENFYYKFDWIEVIIKL